MRRGLMWSLGATSMASVVALWTPRAPGLVSAIDASLNSSLERPTDIKSASESLLEVAPLPATLTSPAVGPAKRDIFVAIQAPLPIQLPTPAAVLGTPAPAAATMSPPPQPPPANARYLGAMIAPDGKRLVYLARGDTPIAVSVGQKLEDGYVVEAISPEDVTLLYPPLDARVKLSVPPAPVQ